MPGARGATGAAGPRGPPGDAGRAGEPGPAGLRVSLVEGFSVSRSHLREKSSEQRGCYYFSTKLQSIRAKILIGAEMPN